MHNFLSYRTDWPPGDGTWRNPPGYPVPTEKIGEIIGGWQMLERLARLSKLLVAEICFRSMVRDPSPYSQYDGVVL